MSAHCNRTSNIAVNDLDAKKFARCGQLLGLTVLVVSGTQCTLIMIRNQQASIHGHLCFVRQPGFYGHSMESPKGGREKQG